MFIITLLFMLAAILYGIKSCIRPKNFPNGPLLLPFIGSWLSLPARYCENKISEWKKKYGGIVGHKIGSFYIVVICGNEEMKEALKHPNFQGRIRSKYFLRRSFQAPLGFFFGDDEIWFEVRRFSFHYFGPIFASKVKDFLHEELLEHFSHIKPGEITNIDGSFMQIPINIMVKILLGENRKKYQDEIEKIRATTEKAFFAGRVTGIESFYDNFRMFSFTGNECLMDAVKCIQDFFQKRLSERKKTFDPLVINDYTDAFIMQQENEKRSTGSIRNYTDQEYLSCITDLIQAGHEATGRTINFFLLYIALNPRVQQKLHEEIDRVIGQNRLPLLEDKTNLPYVEAAMYEVMRINPLAPIGVLHRVTQDTKFKKYFFPEDTVILFPFKEYLYDSDNWDNPNEFLPERFIENPTSKDKVIVFGVGKRSCIGQVLTKNSLFLYITYFFQKYSIHLPDNYSNPSTVPFSGLTNGPKPFKLIITERS